MKKIVIRVVSVLVASALCLPIGAFSSGEPAYQDTDATQPTVQTVKLAAPVLEETAEFTPIEKFPKPVTDALVEAPAAVEANPRAEVLSQQYIGGEFDKDPVSLLAFGGEFLAAYLKGLNNLTSGLVDTGGDLPEFAFDYEDNDGNPHRIYMGMYFDEENQLLIGRDQQGAFMFGFDFDLQQKLMYASYNGVERKMGFSKLYDTLAPAAGIFYKTHRIKFKYGGQDRMIQMWKGIYFLAGTGAEIGLYKKPQSRAVEFYDCAQDDEMLEMSMRLRRDEKILFERAPQIHWWMNGVVLSDGLYPPGALTLEGSIRFEDEGMKAAFLVPFEHLCAEEGIAYNVDGELVSFVW